MANATRGPLIALVERLLPRIKYPWLFVVLAAFLLFDLVIPDPIPFLDEATLALLTVLAGSWRTRRATPGATEPTSPPPAIGAGTDVVDAEEQ
jgi:hypothetical protein